MPRPNAPPSTICPADTSSKVLEGVFMLPEDLRMEAKAFSNHRLIAPPKATLEYASACCSVSPCPTREAEYSMSCQQEQEREHQPQGRADDARMPCQRISLGHIAGTEGAADGGTDATADGTRRQHLLQHHHREDQSDPGQCRRAQLPNVRSFHDTHHGRGHHGHHVRQAHPDDRGKDRRRGQCLRVVHILLVLLSVKGGLPKKQIP